MSRLDVVHDAMYQTVFLILSIVKPQNEAIQAFFKIRAFKQKKYLQQPPMVSGYSISWNSIMK